MHLRSSCFMFRFSRFNVKFPMTPGCKTFFEEISNSQANMTTGNANWVPAFVVFSGNEIDSQNLIREDLRKWKPEWGTAISTFLLDK